jgi:putative flippase GtrA
VVRNGITSFIDFFHPPFKKWMPLQTFRYAACGGSNTVLGFLIYSLSYTFIFHKQVVDLGFYAFEPHVASLILSFFVSFPVGFILLKYVVFVESNIQGRIQLFRYFFVFVSNLTLNYIMLKLMVEKLKVSAIPAQIISTAIVITISYLLQRHFTFKVEDTQVD